MRARADAGNEGRRRHLNRLLAERGDLDELRVRADAGDEDAAGRLAGLLADRGEVDQAARILVALADAGDQAAAIRLAWLLAEREDLDGARASAGRDRMPLLLVAATRGLRARADAGDGLPPGAGRAAGRARRPGRVGRPDRRGRSACRRWPSAGRTGTGGGAPGLTPAARTPPISWPVRWPTAAIWIRLCRSWLWPTPTASSAAIRLADLLAERGDLDGLRGQAEAGDQDAARHLGRPVGRA